MIKTEGSEVSEMGTLLQDLRYGAKSLRKDLAFTVIAVFTLAIGIGANTAMFSVVEGVLLRPLPFYHADRLMTVVETSPKLGWPQARVSGPNFMDWKSQNRVFSELAAYAPPEGFNVITGDTAERMLGMYISFNLFTTLGIQPVLGRGFRPDEERTGKNHQIIISNDFWTHYFASNPTILRKSIRLNNEAYTIVGVMPKSFGGQLFGKINFFIPIALNSKNLRNRATHYLHVVGRLKSHANLSQAIADMDTIARQLARQYPQEDGNWGATVIPLRKDTVGYSRTLLEIFFAAVGFVLLIACVNVANLALARANRRKRELAIRAALGATPSRLFKMLLAESLVLATLAGSLGIVLALWAVKLLVSLNPASIPRLNDIRIDGVVVVFTLAVSLLTACMFGAIPAFYYSKPDLNEPLKEASRAVVGSRSESRIRTSLVVCEVGLAIVLLTGAGLMITSFLKLEHISPGFNPKNLLTLRIALKGSKYSHVNQRVSYYEAVLERLQGLPNVKGVTAISDLPFGDGGMGNRFLIQGRMRPAVGEEPDAQTEVIMTGYFQTMGISLLKGRYFSTRDTAGASGVVIINHTCASYFFSHEDPIGKTLVLLAPDQANSDNIQPRPVQIIGVVADTKTWTPLDPGHSVLYLPYSQDPVPAMYVALRTSSYSTSIIGSVRARVRSVDADQPIFDIVSMQERISDSISWRRFNMFLLGTFALIALMLSGVGIYGTLAYMVRQRTHEIAIRMALGAKRGDILRLVMKEATGLALTGVALGVVMSLIVARVLRSVIYGVNAYTNLIYGVSAHDPVTFIAVIVVISLAVVLATYLPAQRAIEVDPMTAFRCE